MNGVLASRLPKRPFPEEDHAAQALILDRLDERLGVGVQIRGAWLPSNNDDSGVLEQVLARATGMLRDSSTTKLLWVP